MGIRGQKKPQAEVREGVLTGRAGERITVFVLFLIAAFLSYVYFVFLPQHAKGREIVFDYENAMLRAEEGDCVRLQTSENPGAEQCLLVRKRVERPVRGPDSLPGDYNDLRRSLPYLTCELHSEGGAGQGCGGSNTEYTLRALNNFGLDPASQVAVERIVPVWAKWSGGKEGVLYEVTMRRYDQTEMTYVMYISPEMPVTGLVKQEVITKDAPPVRVFYQEIDCAR